MIRVRARVRVWVRAKVLERGADSRSHDVLQFPEPLRFLGGSFGGFSKKVSGELLAPGAHSVETVKGIFSDRSAGVLSVNRYAEDEQGTATNAVFIAVPAERKAYACRGPADRGRWYTLAF